ncbi:hypothetical protein SeMB42_g05875 [Synchytrium endobioticum]|uniref:DNA/RNA-binding protein Alba-like domain-containing protein n=1 Tax=Synchytrium endobioticum TaxID=286115 RepID=A0A507CNQ8_9FUNG|nr:hypothetical protein SeLEV6574_g07196 [Synchytrium endobioticum]TPX40775.1 hypothetical protein SeMB42_g05875 [Synchytrium endobioticum]
MENYRQKEVGEDDPPSDPEEIIITVNSKASQVSQQISKLLQDSLCNQANKEVVISGKGIAMNKAITVVELLKRSWNSHSGILNVSTELDSCKAADLWEPVTADLDRIYVIRNTPRIRLRVWTSTP